MSALQILAVAMSSDAPWGKGALPARNHNPNIEQRSKDAPLHIGGKSDHHGNEIVDFLPISYSKDCQRFLLSMSPAIMQVLYTVA